MLMLRDYVTQGYNKVFSTWYLKIFQYLRSLTNFIVP